MNKLSDRESKIVSKEDKQWDDNELHYLRYPSPTSKNKHQSLVFEFAANMKRMTGKVDLRLEFGSHLYSLDEKLEKDQVVVEFSDKNPYEVNWSGLDDPENPMNWSSERKWFNIALISSITFVA